MLNDHHTSAPSAAITAMYPPYCRHAVQKPRQLPVNAAACRPTSPTQASTNSSRVNQEGIR